MRPLSAPGLIAALSLCLAGCSLSVSEPKTPAWPELQVSAGEQLMVVVVPGGGQALLKRVARNGTVETWMSQDRYTLSLDRGVVVASRGFTFDMMGADAEETLAALAAPQSDPYSRRLRYLNGNEQSIWIRTECEVSRVSDQRGPHLQESCRGFTETYQNLFWLDKAGKIFASKQWISPEIGYLELYYRAN
ncbi:YjbF family lipoprotein [Pseudogemmobacter faecipullorum]|uniref:YjbF family lipoprotein n=1 Tax=Pseudogemmobacter faecipullorum TaxID=2755041 RepID=A0ABS8CMX4_9RHOB|nr:YjbF family lipoprotein [Pseudogemmobacter faecipullorum]MCB5410727.1 YjbF family lipoprotein [Pseudogemmobacter faecipullorum]